MAVTATGKAHRVEGVRVNSVFANPRSDDSVQWVDDNRTLLVHLVPANREGEPQGPTVPKGPHVQESSGRAGPVRTYEDMLSTPHDEDLLDYYATAQLAYVDVQTGRITAAGAPGLYLTARPSPDGQHLLMVRAHKPYSYLHPVEDFPKDVEIWSRSGKVERKIASLPLEDRVPIGGVPTGPRAYVWRPSAPATLLWIEALDGGNPKEKAPHRDKLMMLKAPFQGDPAEVTKFQQRLTRVSMGEKTGLLLASDYDRDRRWIRTYEMNLDEPAASPTLLWERNIQDRYKDPGQPSDARRTPSRHP